MLNNIFLYLGSGLIILWGVFHILLTKGVLSEFENTSKENLRIIRMEWIMEGLTLCFIGILVLILTLFVSSQSLGSLYVYRISSAMLIAMALVTFLTGSKTEAIPLKFNPYIKITTAVLFLAGSFV